MRANFSFLGLLLLAVVYSAMQFPWIEFALADNALTPVKATGATALKATDGMVQARVSIKTHIVNIGVPQDALPKQRTSNCTYSRYPCSLVDRIDFSVDGKNVFAARSVFADLADIEGAGLKNDGNDFILSLKCGDASEAYNVTIRFNSTQVLDRKISDPRTGYVLQETRYSPLELLN